MEWGLTCSEENKLSTLRSVFFVGAFLGLLIGTVLFDKIGRRATTLLGITLTTLSCLAAVFVHSYYLMLPLRIVHGMGSFVTVTGVDLLSIELTPSKMRNFSQILNSLAWDFGAFIIIAIAYLVKNWHHMYLVQVLILAPTAIPIFLYPESPRFHLVKGKESEARDSFKKLSKIFNTQTVVMEAKLTYNDYKKDYFGQIKDFKRYPLMLKHTVILMTCWMIIGCVTYGLLFSWSKLGADIYSTLFYSRIGDVVARGTGLNYLIIRLLGRKKAVIVTFAVLSGLFFLSVLSFGVRITETWDLDHVVCLFAAPVIGSVWDSVSLLSKELSPTSHQGMIYCLCSASARVGAFAGPYLILLYDVVDPRVVLSIFGGLTALSSVVASFNSDSTHKPIPLTPDQLVSLHFVGIGRDEIENPAQC